jgi:uncharacterized protein with GYD domain
MRRVSVPKYLLQASYSAEGSKGLVKDGGTKRMNAARTLVESLGGKLEAMYFAFGDTDVVAIMDLPDNASAASVSLTVAGTGALTGKVTVLLTPGDIDQAARKSPTYTPPGR